MKIGVDLTAVRTAGTIVYARGFVPALARWGSAHDFDIYASPELCASLDQTAGPRFRLHPIAAARSTVKRVIWEQSVLPVHLRREGTDVLFAAFDIAPIFAPCPIVLAIRNPVSAVLAGQWTAPPGWRRTRALVHARLSRASARAARSVFFPTSFAADVLGATVGVAPEKRSIIFHGTDREFWSAPRDSAATLARLGLTRCKFLLFVSDFYFYKDPDVLLRAFALWRESARIPDFRVVLVGRMPDARRRTELESFVSRLGLAGVASFPGHIPQEDLAVLYQSASAFVLPTRLETFGQPFVEALAAGAPVICADTPFARELCGEAAIYFPVGDASALAAELDSLLRDEWRADVMRAASRRRSRLFSWDREARETLSLLEAAVCGSPRTGRGS